MLICCIFYQHFCNTLFLFPLVYIKNLQRIYKEQNNITKFGLRLKEQKEKQLKDFNEQKHWHGSKKPPYVSISHEDEN